MKKNKLFNPKTDTLFKHKETDKTYWVSDGESYGKMVFTFDKKTFFNLFTDYPDKLTPEQKKIFDEEYQDLGNYHGDYSEFGTNGDLDTWQI